MSQMGRPLLFALVAAAMMVGGTTARAAGDSFAGGGVLQDGFEALQRQLAHQVDNVDAEADKLRADHKLDREAFFSG